MRWRRSRSTSRSTRRVEEVSVANKQLIAISKALRQNARLIIMDEPTSALTEREIRALFAVIHKLQARGITFLFVSHKLNEVLEIFEKSCWSCATAARWSAPATAANTTTRPARSSR